MNRVAIKPQLLRWACERAGFDAADLEHKFPRLADWESGEAQPTLKQVEAFAKATYTPVGYLFLQEPPVEKVPIPDFRSMGNERIGHLDHMVMPMLRSTKLQGYRLECCKLAVITSSPMMPRTAAVKSANIRLSCDVILLCFTGFVVGSG